MYISLCVLESLANAQVQKSNNRTIKGDICVLNETKKKKTTDYSIITWFFFLSSSSQQHTLLTTEIRLFSTQEITTTSKSRSRTDTCATGAAYYYLLYFQFSSRTSAAGRSSRASTTVCSGLTFLSAYWCWFVLLFLLFLLLLLLLSLPLCWCCCFYFYTTIFSRTRQHTLASLALSFSSLFFSCTDSSTVLALSLVTFSSPSPQKRRTLIIRRLFFTYSIIHFFAAAASAAGAVSHTYILTFQLPHSLTACIYCSGWLVGCSIEKIISHQLILNFHRKCLDTKRHLKKTWEPKSTLHKSHNFTLKTPSFHRRSTLCVTDPICLPLGSAVHTFKFLLQQSTEIQSHRNSFRGTTRLRSPVPCLPAGTHRKKDLSTTRPHFAEKRSAPPMVMV